MFPGICGETTLNTDSKVTGWHYISACLAGHLISYPRIDRGLPS